VSESRAQLAFRLEVQEGGFLNFAGVSRVVEHIQAGDLCLVPSDSAYVLTGLPSEPGVTGDIDSVLMRDGLAMSLAFGSLREARRWVKLSSMALRFVGELTPGGLTFVAEPTTVGRRGFAQARLHAPGTIGIRLTESRVETQLAYEVEHPLTSTPVRLQDGSLALSAEDALDAVSARVAALPSARRLGLIVGPVMFPGRLSTVVTEDSVAGALARIRVLRLGAIPLATLREVARSCQFDAVVTGDPGHS
jgi:tRNA A37 threonylcarbamoyladenosine synthetase subunit TsaC/SUA5/YrdC